MRRSKSLCLFACTILCVCVASQAQTFTTLVNFGGTDGSNPSSPLVQGLDGDLYGAASSGGNNSNCSGIGGCGTLFKTGTDGVLTTVYNFCPVSQCQYGRTPGSTLPMTPTGDFYGTTPFGGAKEWGEVFRITPGGSLDRLYSFCSQTNCADGQNPSSLIRATDGNLYGVAFVGGAHGEGTVFKLSPHGTLTTLYNFCALANCADGQEPNGVLQATNGSFYGTTYAGGPGGRGTIFEINPSGTLTTLYIFCAQGGLDCPDGGYPGGLLQAADGNLYGTTASGGVNDGGSVFRISPGGTFKSLYSFCAQTNCADGGGPSALIQATDGNFYGTTGGGGTGNGTIFKVTSSGALITLYDFCPEGCAIGLGAGGLVQHTDGNFYGGTIYGGDGACAAPGCGTIFKFAVGLGPFVKAVVPHGKAGSSVTILGTNLTGSTSVNFNTTAAAFTIVSATEITATVPTGATTGKIQVVTPSGTLRSDVTFRVLP